MAVFYQILDIKAEEIEEDKAWFSTRSNAIVLKKWNPKEVLLNRKIPFTVDRGGRSPTKSWQAKIFKKIGEICGSLVELDGKTVEKHRLFAPRLRVRVNKTGFIPGEIDSVFEEENKFTIRLRSCSRLDLKNRNRGNLGLEEGMHNQCVIRIRGEIINKKMWDRDHRKKCSMGDTLLGETQKMKMMAMGRDEYPLVRQNIEARMCQ
ncbi:hypothetical protein LguiB_028145 [Lonicera macranthoides]